MEPYRTKFDVLYNQNLERKIDPTIVELFHRAQQVFTELRRNQRIMIGDKRNILMNPDNTEFDRFDSDEFDYFRRILLAQGFELVRAGGYDSYTFLKSHNNNNPDPFDDMEYSIIDRVAKCTDGKYQAGPDMAKSEEGIKDFKIDDVVEVRYWDDKWHRGKVVDTPANNDQTIDVQLDPDVVQRMKEEGKKDNFTGLIYIRAYGATKGNIVSSIRKIE